LSLLLSGFLFTACNRGGTGFPVSIKEGAEGAYIAAIEAYAQEFYTEALEYVRESLRRDSRFYQARLLEGKILFFQNKMAEAQGIFSGLCTKYPEYTEARIWNLRCLVLFCSQSGKEGPAPEKNLRDARRALDREISFNPSDWRVLYLYTLLAGNSGDWEQKLSMGRRAEAALSDSVKLYLDMALDWHSLGLEDRAALYIDKARILSGGNTSLSRLGETTADFLFSPGKDAGDEILLNRRNGGNTGTPSASGAAELPHDPPQVQENLFKGD
jgi:tetratricopeptide (TPR) repeat protein